MKQFRRALEGHTDVKEPSAEEDNFLVMKGPLSQVFTDALNKVYAKDNIATESAANDTLMALAGDFAGQAEASDNSGGNTTVYGVSGSDINEDDFVNISSELSGPDKLVLVIDGTNPGPNSTEDSIPAERVQELSDMTTAMEAFVKHAGGRVYHSLEEFAASRKPRRAQ